MLKTEEIIRGLQSIVDGYSTIAIAWHLVFFILIAALIAKWKPTMRIMGLMVFLPLLSVGVLAWLAGNPFNGTVFSISALLVLIFGLKATNQRMVFSTIPFIIGGVIMVIFGLIYPHFIRTDSLVTFFLASPAGLIPCPTLSVLAGLLLLFKGAENKPITLTLVILGLFYGIFGIFKLAVYVDLFLLFGSIVLLVKFVLSFRNPAV